MSMNTLPFEHLMAVLLEEDDVIELIDRIPKDTGAEVGVDILSG